MVCTKNRNLYYLLLLKRETGTTVNTQALIQACRAKRLASISSLWKGSKFITHKITTVQDFSKAIQIEDLNFLNHCKISIHQ